MTDEHIRDIIVQKLKKRPGISYNEIATQVGTLPPLGLSCPLLPIPAPVPAPMPSAAEHSPAVPHPAPSFASINRPQLCLRLRYAAAQAYEHKRPQLATFLLDHEPRAADQAPVALQRRSAASAYSCRAVAADQSRLAPVGALTHGGEGVAMGVHVDRGKEWWVGGGAWQVPLLISMQEDERALMKAIEGGDTDLVFLALLHMKRKKCRRRRLPLLMPD